MGKFYTVCHPLGKGGKVAGLLTSLGHAARKEPAVLAFLEARLAVGTAIHGAEVRGPKQTAPQSGLSFNGAALRGSAESGFRLPSRTAARSFNGGALDIDKADLKTPAAPFYFAQASGKVEVDGTVNVLSPTGEVLVGFPNPYGRLGTEAVLSPILVEQAARFFRQAFTLEIDCGKLPSTCVLACPANSPARQFTPARDPRAPASNGAPTAPCSP